MSLHHSPIQNWAIFILENFSKNFPILFQFYIKKRNWEQIISEIWKEYRASFTILVASIMHLSKSNNIIQECQSKLLQLRDTRW